MADHSDHDEARQPPPVNFQRMISWQLSQIPDYSQTDSNARRKKKAKARKAGTGSNLAPEIERISTIPRVQTAETYVVTNSEGEDEVYYSAVESPFASSDDSDEDECSEHYSDNVACHSLILKPETSHSPVLELPRPSPSRSKKSKKRRREIHKAERKEFFQPLCSLLDEKISLDVSEDLPNYSTIPSLSDLCLRFLRNVPQADGLPYLISSLVSGAQQISSVVTLQRQWLQKQLNDVEMFGFNEEKRDKKEHSDEEPPYIYDIPDIWDTALRPINIGHIDERTFPHIPLPLPNARVCNDFRHLHLLFPLILHYMNFYYPLALDDHGSGKTLSEVQNMAIGQLSYSFQSSYPKLSKQYSKCLKLWPAYMHWARGNLAVAAGIFANEIDNLTGLDQAVSINEMARMFSWFGDRKLAMFYFRKSSEVPLCSRGITKYDVNLLKTCYFALQASVWDTGSMDTVSAIEAQNVWQIVLKECASDQYPKGIWYLPVSAVESKLRIHAGQLTKTSATNKCNKAQTLLWLEECEKIINDINLRHYPILQYHLSLVYAMKGAKMLSMSAFTTYLNDFAGFGDWPDGLPGAQFHAVHVGHHRPHPWQHLFTLMEQSKLLHVPIMKIYWRIRLLHPLFVYGQPINYPTVADYTPYNGRLELRIVNGYLTGDMQMNIPPLKTVLLDPYEGHICFSRRTSLQHWYLNMPSRESPPDSSTLPWPLHLYETSECTVELELCHRMDVEYGQIYESNYRAMLHYYGSNGSHFKVDLRKLIRKEQKNAVLASYKNVKVPPETVAEYVEKMMDYGFSFSLETLSHMDKVPTVYSEKAKGNNRRRLYRQFILYLRSHILFGQGTILLQLSLHDSHNDPNVLVFINCTTVEKFLSPTIYCTGCKSAGFSSLWPDVDTALLYSSRHLSHVKHVTVLKSEMIQYSHNHHNQSFLTFDEDGSIVHVTENITNARIRQAVLTDCTLGKRLYHKNLENKCVECYTATKYNILSESESLPINEIQSVTTVPCAVLVSSLFGLTILNPATLEKMEIIDGMEDLSMELDGVHAPPQFIAQNAKIDILKVFNVVHDDAVNDMNTGHNEAEQHDSDSISSCCFAVSINDRLLILQPSTKVLLDVYVPGKATEIHPIAGNGYIVVASQFSDTFRSDLYWLSSGGLLKGMLPCLGYGNHCLFSAQLSEKETESKTHKGGIYLYFYDGEGAICCVRLRDVHV